MRNNILPAGAVLAGGKSSRLGQDKGRLVLGGTEMLTRTIRLLQRLLDDVAVIGREHPDVASIADDIPGAGPVGAVTTALRCTEKSCLVLSCDLPFMRVRTLSILIKAWGEKKPGTLATAFRHGNAGKIEGLVAIYEPGALAFLESALRDNLLKLALVIPEKHYTFVPVPPSLKEDFFNINRPEDLHEAERRFASLRR